jgi:Co/Zn/Cd efflux system component
VAHARTVGHDDPGIAHEHAPARRVLGAVGITVVAAAVELAGSWSGRSLFLVADAVHLLSHVGIFAVLLAPRRWWHERWEDRTALAVLGLVAAIAVGITATSVYGLARGVDRPPDPALMLLSLFGLTANGIVASGSRGGPRDCSSAGCATAPGPGRTTITTEAPRRRQRRIVALHVVWCRVSPAGGREAVHQTACAAFAVIARPM